MKVYSIHPLLRVILIFFIFLNIYGIYNIYLAEEYTTLLVLIIGEIIFIYFGIIVWNLQLILTNEGIRIKAWGYIWQEFLEWEEIQNIDATYGLYSAPHYILIPKEGRAMYLAGVKNMDKLLLEITQYAPHAKLHPKVRKKVEKAKNKV